MAGEIAVGMLIDLSSPVVENADYGKNTLTPTEMVRSDESDRRLSYTLVSPVEKKDRILKDVTEKINFQMNSSPEMLIQDEIFDFDSFIMSENDSLTMDEQEKEVFFGSVGFKEKLVSSVISSSEFEPMSPNNPEQLEEIFREAHIVAYHLANAEVSSSPEKIASPSKKAEKCVPTINIEQCGPRVCDPNHDDKSAICLKSVAGTSSQSKLKKPTKLAQVRKSTTYTCLPKVKSCENIDQLTVDGFPGGESKSTEHVEQSALERTRYLSGRSEANSDTQSIGSDISDSSASRLPVLRKMVKSSLPNRKSCIPGLVGNKQIPTVKSGIPAVKSKMQAPICRKPATKAPILGKLRLVRPGKMQNSKLAFPQGKPTAAASGPVKALFSAKLIESQSKPNKAPVKPETFENTKPEQIRASSTKTAQSTVTKSSLQAHTNRLSVNARKPVKSNSSSTGSYGSDTPNRRRSNLPTPSKQSSSSSIPPSPLTNRSSVSSNASNGSRRLLSSDGGESPMFPLRCKPATPRKHSVQNTPDVPKKRQSVWSPVRRNYTSDDLPFLCTKRTKAKF